MIGGRAVGHYLRYLSPDPHLAAAQLIISPLRLPFRHIDYA